MTIFNPLANSLFLPLAGIFSFQLLFGLIAVLLGRTFTKDSNLKHQLLLRWTSWAVIASVTVLVLLSGPPAFALLSALVSTVCTDEFCRTTARPHSDRIILLLLSAAFPIATAIFPQSLPALLVLGFFILAANSLRKPVSFESSCISLAGLLYPGLLVSHAVLLYALKNNGPQLVITVIASSALANIFAFVFGKVFGGAKLAPAISPNKTWSGAAGSVFGAYLGYAMLAAASSLSLSIPLALALPLVVAASGISGDLFESQMKRSFHVKDAGTWLPGFGGALDRVDGLLFVIPCVYYLVSMVH